MIRSTLKNLEINQTKMPKNEANLPTSARSTSDGVRGYRHLTEEEKNRLEIIASDDSQVVFYKPRRKKKKKRAAIDNIDLAASPPRETGELKKNKKKPIKTVAAGIDNIGRVDTAANNIRSDREQTSVLARRQERSIRNDMEQPSANAPHQGRNTDRSNTSAEPITASRMGYRTRSAIHSMTRYKAIKLAQVLLALYIGILTYADIGPPGGLRDTVTGLIIDQASPERTARGLILVNGTERAIVGATYFQVVCVGITRMSAFFMYPALVFVYFSKLRATNAFLTTTPFAMFMYKDLHELHIYCGMTILFFSCIHTIFHLARWAEQGNLYLAYTHFSGITGLIIILSCLFICVPMTIFKDKIRYEIRKRMHYLFIVFAFALCFHTPRSAIPNGGFTAWVFGILLVWYFLDATYCYFFMTEKITTTNFRVLPSGVRMDLSVSKRFQKSGEQGGYVYVCLPWVSKNQWHAFSLFENPENPAERQIFVLKTGDWTSKVHSMLQRNTVRPVWVNGPFPSPYNNAEAYDNQILVASGIGITPALSVIRAHKNSRRINLIWAVRDRHLLEFFLKHLYLDHQGWNLIFYTGKEKLSTADMDVFTNTNVRIIEGRPNLKQVIPAIIYGVESGLGLPERYHPEVKTVASEMLLDRLSCASGDGQESASIENLACYASELGFQLAPEVIARERRLSAAEEMAPKRSRRSSASIMGHLEIGFRPWEEHPDAHEYVKNLDRHLVIPTWGLLYCGGAKQVEADLKKIADDYQLGIHIESFAW